jgi:hypothetical protein
VVDYIVYDYKDERDYRGDNLYQYMSAERFEGEKPGVLEGLPRIIVSNSNSC